MIGLFRKHKPKKKVKTDKKFLTVKEVADMLDISTSSVYNYIWRRKLPFIKLEGVIRINKKQLDDWLDKQTVMP